MEYIDYLDFLSVSNMLIQEYSPVPFCVDW